MIFSTDRKSVLTTSIHSFLYVRTIVKKARVVLEIANLSVLLFVFVTMKSSSGNLFSDVKSFTSYGLVGRNSGNGSHILRF